MEKIKLYYRRLRDIFIYSDTQVMELVLVLVITLINPTSMERLNYTPSWWIIAGIFLAAYLFLGVIQNCIVKRFWATNLLFAHSVGILAFEIMGGELQTNQLSYAVQALVIGYITWKCGREHAYKCALKLKCKGRIQNGK
jgi:lysylphosphatidylglycerol synthetase-like protein (DUF2156 family)